MKDKVRAEVDEIIEKELENAVPKGVSAKEAVQFLGEATEHMYAYKNFSVGELFRTANEILIPRLLAVSGEEALTEPDQDRLLEAAMFCSHYRQIRDYIYYSFTKESALKWKKTPAGFRVRVQDYSIFRQLSAEVQCFAMNSREFCKGNMEYTREEVLSFLEGKHEWDTSDETIQKSLARIEKETKIKLSSFSPYLDDSSELSLGGYTYSEFYEAYKQLLFMAMCERYYSEANKQSHVITYTVEEIAEVVSDVVNSSEEKSKKILIDISKSSRETFVYISRDDVFLLFPASFSLLDVAGERLKLLASSDASLFSSRFAMPIGDALCKDVFEQLNQFENFVVFRDYSLQGCDPSLPDIDVLSISYEPSFGFHVLACEVKNSLPATWGKESLKAISKKGPITKGQRQIYTITEFLASEAGSELLFSLIKEAYPGLDYKSLFPSGFCCAITGVLTTSQSLGLFVEDKKTSIVNFDLFRHIVGKSDGDVVFITSHLRSIEDNLQNTFSVSQVEFSCNDTIIKYDAAKMEHLLEIEQNSYLSTGVDKKIEKEAIEEGYSFINTLIMEE